MDICTNNQPRDIIKDYQLTQEERKEFDYLDWEAIDKGEDSATFFRYKGRLYDLGEFVRCGDNFVGWDGYSSDSYFSGVLVRFADDCERVIVGQYFS